MKTKLSLKEVQQESIDIYKYVSIFLDDLNLKYFAFCGTLLGAVRHKGFIPWDDDIDIAMLRCDYDKLIKYIKENGNVINDFLYFEGFEIDNGMCQFLKVRNKNFIVEQDISFDKNLWIDIFPLDKLPNDKKDASRFLRKQYVLHHLYGVKKLSFKNIVNANKGFVNKFIKIISKILIFFVNKDYLVNRIIRNSLKYKDIDSKYVGRSICPLHSNQIYSIDDFEICELDFDGIKVKAPKGYDDILKNTYGDYMKLPDEKKRRHHNMNVYSNK